MTQELYASIRFALPSEPKAQAAKIAEAATAWRAFVDAVGKLEGAVSELRIGPAAEERVVRRRRRRRANGVPAELPEFQGGVAA